MMFLCWFFLHLHWHIMCYLSSNVYLTPVISFPNQSIQKTWLSQALLLKGGCYFARPVGQRSEDLSLGNFFSIVPQSAYCSALPSSFHYLFYFLCQPLNYNSVTLGYLKAELQIATFLIISACGWVALFWSEYFKRCYLAGRSRNVVQSTCVYNFTE